MPSAALSPAPKLQFFDSNGNPLTGGKVYTYAAGTTTPLSTYVDSGGVTTNTNPIILDVRGEANIWLDGAAYKFVLKNANDTLIWTVDNITSTEALKAYVDAQIAALSANLANTSDVAKGDALIGFRQSNALGVLPNAVGRTVHQKLQEMISVKDFGAVGDGVTNDATAIQNAINSVQSARGGIIYFPPGNYAIQSPLTVTASGVILQGAGGDNFHDGGPGDALAGTTITWTGAINIESIITFKTIQNPANGKIAGVGMFDIKLECNNLISGGLTIISINKGTFQRLTVTNPRYAAYVSTSYAPGQLAEACDAQDNLFMQCSFRCLDFPESENADGFNISGTQFANSSFNTYINCMGQIKNGRGFYLEFADNITLIASRVITAGGGTGKALFIRGADTNYFYGFSGSSGITIQGAGEGAWATPIGNCFLFPDQGNATVYPTLGIGVRIFWQGQYGALVKGIANKMAVADSDAVAIAASVNQGNYSLVVSNDSSALIKLANSSGPNWQVGLTNFYGTNDLRFTPGQAGSYFYMLADTGFQSETYFPGASTTASGANAFLNNASTPANQLLRSTSSAKYKTQIEDVEPKYVDNISKLRPVWYRSLASADNKNWSWYGLVAEEVAKVEPRLVVWSYSDDCYTEETVIDEANVEQVKRTLKPGSVLSPDGVQYDRITALLVAKVNQLEARLDQLEAKP